MESNRRELSVSFIDRSSDGEQFRVKVDCKFNPNDEQNFSRVSRVVSARMFLRLMEMAGSLIKDNAVAALWLITPSEACEGRAPVDFLVSLRDFGKIISLIYRLRVFKFVMARPEEMVIFDADGKSSNSWAGRFDRALRPEEYLARGAGLAHVGKVACG